MKNLKKFKTSLIILLTPIVVYLIWIILNCLLSPFFGWSLYNNVQVFTLFNLAIGWLIVLAIIMEIDSFIDTL